MSNPYYPPGHPSGIHGCEVTIICEVCGHSFDVPGTYDAAVNYAEPTDSQIECPECGHIDGEPVPVEADEDPIDAEMRESLPGVLALGARLADIVRADHEARLDYADSARRVEGIGHE